MIGRAALYATLCAVLVIGSETAFAQGPGCRPYRVNTSVLAVTNEPRIDGIYVDVLEGGDIACVSREQTIGGRDWHYVLFKVKRPGERQTVEGWALRQGMTVVPMAHQGPVAASPAAPSSDEIRPPAAGQLVPAPAAIPPEDVLRFEQPVPFGPFPVIGNTIKQLADRVPLFPPIEGQDEALWQKNCSNCHKWDRQTLCQQGATYLANPRNVLRQRHPFGGSYKVALMRWSKSGCQ